jgi:hypothetical protein
MARATEGEDGFTQEAVDGVMGADGPGEVGGGIDFGSVRIADRGMERRGNLFDDFAPVATAAGATDAESKAIEPFGLELRVEG